MNLDNAIDKHKAKQTAFKELKDQLGTIGGPQFREFVLAPTYEVMRSRSELVRDVCASVAQQVLEREALKLLALEGEARDQAISFLTRDPVAWLRVLTKQTVQTIHALPVADGLQKVIDEL